MKLILLVEDQEALRVAVSLLLEKSWFNVISACDGESALHLFRHRLNDIGVVLLDLTLPGISGAEVCRELRRLKPDIDVVLTSAYDLEHIGMEFACGGERRFHFVRKPYRASDLVRSLREILLQRTQQSTAP